MSKENTIIILLVLSIIFILNFFGIRICPFFNIFKIPCPGCGLTRSIKSILSGHIIEGMKYNVLGIPLILIFIIYIILILSKKKKYLDSLLYKNKRILILVSIIITIIVWIININNPKLY